MLKIIQTELFQRITDTMLEIAGENAGLLEPMEGNRDLNPAGSTSRRGRPRSMAAPTRSSGTS